MTLRRTRESGVVAAAMSVLYLLMPLRLEAQDSERDPPVGVPVHEMLEDPFNRSVLFDELESYDGGDEAWDATFWAGRTFDKLLVRTEGKRSGGSTEDAELELLWSHSVARWWDVVAGARADFEPGPSQSWAAFGVQGLAPYRFEVEATAYLGAGGETAARFEAEYELLITPRLILQPEIELDWYGQTHRARRIGPGLSTGEAALRLRYEFRREIAPYVGLVRERKFGATADHVRASGRDADDTRLVAGIRIRF